MQRIIKVVGYGYIVLAVIIASILEGLIIIKWISDIELSEYRPYSVPVVISVLLSASLFLIGYHLIRMRLFARNCAMILAASYALVADLIATMLLFYDIKNPVNLIASGISLVIFFLFALIYLELSRYSVKELFVGSILDKKYTFLKWVAYLGTVIQILGCLLAFLILIMFPLVMDRL